MGKYKQNVLVRQGNIGYKLNPKFFMTVTAKMCIALSMNKQIACLIDLCEGGKSMPDFADYRFINLGIIRKLAVRVV
jgi:hypothetical protein